MHGFIISEIKKYVELKLGAPAWLAVLDKAGLGKKEYENFLNYPDEEAVAIVVTASEITGIPVAAILEDFGFFLGGHLMKIYRPLIDPSWRTLDFLANVEQTIHHIVRTRNRQAKPPALVCERTSPGEVVILYQSPRNMNALAWGIIKGVAAYYGDEIEVSEVAGLYRGAPAHQIYVRRLS